MNEILSTRMSYRLNKPQMDERKSMQAIFESIQNIHSEHISHQKSVLMQCFAFHAGVIVSEHDRDIIE